MQNSIFCLQQPGYSSPRKLFYDAIMCGCIPVIVKENHTITYDYPISEADLIIPLLHILSPVTWLMQIKILLRFLESVSENMRQKSI